MVSWFPDVVPYWTAANGKRVTASRHTAEGRGGRHSLSAFPEGERYEAVRGA